MSAQDFPVYYINLDSNTERRAEIEAHLAAAGIGGAIRVPAFDGRGLDLDQLPDCDTGTALRFLGRPLRGGEYGCYRSHLACLERFLSTDSPFAVVLEDDTLPPPHSLAAIREVLQYLESRNQPWDLVHLGGRRLKYFTPVAGLASGGQLVRAYYFPMVTSALLWSRAGARRILSDYAKVTMPIDTQLREVMTRDGHGYALKPALIPTSAAPSDIDGAGKRKAAGRIWSYGWLKQRRLWKNKLRAQYRKLTERA